VPKVDKVETGEVFWVKAGTLNLKSRKKIMKGSTPIQSASTNGWPLRAQLSHSVEAETGKNSFDASIVKGKPIETHQELDKRNHAFKNLVWRLRNGGSPCRRFSAYEVDQVRLLLSNHCSSLRVNTGASGAKKE